MSSSDQEDNNNPLPESTQFIYTGHQRYISLKEQLKTSLNSYEIVNSFILDPQLSVILKVPKVQIDLSEKIIKKNRQQKIKYLIQNENECEQYAKVYNKHVQINTFLLGRQCRNRNFNCILIHCDLISRSHTKIKVNAINKRLQMQLLRKILKEVVQQSHFSSKIRKLSYCLWQKILEYAQGESQYTIKDEGSRNGTFLINESLHFAAINKEQSYEFERQHYLIRVNDILTHKGSQLAKEIDKIQADFDRLSLYRHQYTKKVVYCNGLTKQTLMKSQQQTHCLFIQVEYSQSLKFFFVIIIKKGEQMALNMGSGQIIGINEKAERMNYEISQHGKIVFMNNRWFLYPSDKKGYVWTKLPSKVKYPLLTTHNYRFRLGHLNNVYIKFHNFQK